MSAYLCSQSTINAIATFAHAHGIVRDDQVAAFAYMLTLQNVLSLQTLYRERSTEMVEPALGYAYEPVEASAAEIVTMAKEYDYQACETDGYDRSLTSRLMEKIFYAAQEIEELERPGGCGAARFKRFFSIDDGKAVKSQAIGYLRAINYMAPADTAGVGNMCPDASPVCKAGCLGTTSGQAGMRNIEKGEQNSVTLSRIAKARFYMGEREAFMGELSGHIAKVWQRARAETQGRLSVRLNGSTDIGWHAARVAGRSLMREVFPQVQFDDYTKSFNRMKAFLAGKLPANYHLTFSRSEVNEAECLQVLAMGGNVAVVFEKLPKRW